MPRPTPSRGAHRDSAQNWRRPRQHNKRPGPARPNRPCLRRFERYRPAQMKGQLSPACAKADSPPQAHHEKSVPQTKCPRRQERRMTATGEATRRAPAPMRRSGKAVWIVRVAGAKIRQGSCGSCFEVTDTVAGLVPMEGAANKLPYRAIGSDRYQQPVERRDQAIWRKLQPAAAIWSQHCKIDEKHIARDQAEQ